MFSTLPPTPCQYYYIVKTKAGEVQTRRNNIEREIGRSNLLYPLVKDICEKCVILVCLNYFAP